MVNAAQPYNRVSLLLLPFIAATAHGFLSSPRSKMPLSMTLLPSSRISDKDGVVVTVQDSKPEMVSRRDILSVTTSIFLLGTTTILPNNSAANAFPNKISTKYDDRPKRRGPAPKDLGVRTRKDMVGEEYLGLKNCGPAPNCFCSTEDPEDELDPDHYIPAWSYPEGTDREAAFRQLEAVVNAYEPGQANVDGGGFAVKTVDYEKGYLYVQFEALKNGYIDDVEFAVISGKDGDRDIQVRSSSRVGYLDYGVNAKRLNYIAKGVKNKGWTAPGVDFKTHPNYSTQNGIASN